jgi:EAL domain-containing protein (putative c-di-GMP-specific phosphodiesterase class I)
VSLDTSRIVEVEALVRWQHPVRGLIQPNDFIPVAEETGLIVPIGRWVLEEACRQVATWVHELPTPAISVSVNLSARQFEHPGLLGDIERALLESELDPSLLTVEITEGVVMKDPVTAAAKLREIKALGVRVAVDDFGTGYSSLAYLKTFPVDSLKIDRSFTQGLGDEGDDSAIVRSVVALGHALRLSVTAEGIETADQLAYLQTLECDRGQGYLFARPIPADELAPVLGVVVSEGQPRRVA